MLKKHRHIVLVFMIFLGPIVVGFIVLVQRVCMKIKDTLMLSVVWHREILKVV